MECLPLLFAGIAMSTCDSGESVSQNAMVGRFTYADSEMGCTARRKTCQHTNRTNARAGADARRAW